jgi:hypothetical protein
LRLLLRLRLVLTTALATSCDGSRSGARTGIAHDSPDNGASRRPTMTECKEKSAFSATSSR